jgi:DME family drug/metabolite transporter
MDQRTANRLLLIAAACLFSTGGAAIKATSLASWQVASFRSAVAVVAVLAMMPAARKGWNARTLLVACAYAATLLLFVLATKMTTAANAIFLQSAAPLVLILIGPWLLKESIRARDLGLAAVLALGLTLFFVGRETALTAPRPVEGNILAALSAITWALTLAGLRWLGRGGRAAAQATVAAGNLIAALVALPMALPLVHWEWKDGAVLLYLGVCQIGLAYVCLTRAIRHVPAFEASTLLLIEPALNPVWAWAVHGERPSPWALAGGALILGATFFHTWRQNRSAALDARSAASPTEA